MNMTLELPHRPEKPRQKGLTAITDTGIPLGELARTLESYHEFVDMAKLSIGTAYVEPRLDEKIACYESHGIPVYFGGTLFEKFYSQGLLDDYLSFLKAHGIGIIEISCGTISLDRDEIIRLIHKLKKTLQVMVEVGKKKADPDFTHERWVGDVKAALDAGCSHVILEGRNKADAGIYTAQGILDENLVQKIKEAASPERLIFEAPTPKSQSQLINLLGANVNLGNIFAKDLLFLETQRRGLKAETFLIC